MAGRAAGAGDTALIHEPRAGLALPQSKIAQAFGGRAIGTASEANQEYLSELGTEPVTYGPGLAERVRSWLPTPEQSPQSWTPWAARIRWQRQRNCFRAPAAR